MTALFLTWVALLGADRINLLGADSPFVLTPYLVLSPLVVLGEVARRIRTGRGLQLSRRTPTFCLLALALMSLAVSSVFVSRDLSSSAPRVAQLALMLGGAFAVAMAVQDRDDLGALFARGARLGLLLYALFDVAQLLAWLEIVPTSLPEQQAMLQLSPDMYAGVVPRLSGMVMDSNRGGLLLVLFGYFVAAGDEDRARAWRWISLAAVLLLLTLSRSSMLAAGGAIAMLLFEGHRVQLPRRLIASFATVVVAVSALLLTDPRVRGDAFSAIEPLRQRFTLLEGSSQDHVRLLDRGVATATGSVSVALHGIGYGSSHLALQDFFPGDRYGNFHSIYVGIFAEAGIFALLVLVLLMAVPLVGAGAHRPLVVAVALFGLFYGALAEPAFWLALVLAWLPPWTITSRPKASASVTAMPNTAPSTN